MVPQYVLVEIPSAKTLALVFRGTWTKEDVAADLNFVPKDVSPSHDAASNHDILVHRGFEDMLEPYADRLVALVDEHIKGRDDWRVAFVGHSMGGAQRLTMQAWFLMLLCCSLARANFDVQGGQKQLLVL